MTYAIINNRTNKVMEHADSLTDAKEILTQYNEMGKDYDEEYYGTYRIERA